MDPILNTNGQVFRVCEPYLGGNEAKYVNQALVKNQISSQGDFVKKFASEFAKKMGCKYAVPTSSGFTALYLALRAFGLKEGDEVIVPTFTMIATPNAVRLCGATPVFVDCLENGNINTDLIEQAITKKTAGILPVHVYGRTAEMAVIRRIATKHGLFTLEDAAEAHGAKYQGMPAGALGHAAAYSFYANKLITSGEGGMITTNDPKIAETVESLRDYAFTPGRHFWHQQFAINGRMSNLEAAIGLAQTEHLGEYIEARKCWAEGYQELETYMDDIIVERYGKDDVCWMAGVRVRDKKTGDNVPFKTKLASVGIETRNYFIPCHLQPIYYNKGDKEFPISEKLSRQGLYLPTYSHYSKKLQNKIINLIKQVCRSH